MQELKNFDVAAAFVRENAIRMIDLKFSDLWGRWHHVTLSASEFTPNLMVAGIGFDGSSVGLRSVKSGDMVLREGESGSAFYLIISGRVEVRKGMRGGQFKALVNLGPADLLGELGFFGAENRTASVMTVSECNMLQFDKDVFKKFAEANPEIGMKVYRGMAEVLSKRLTRIDESLMDTIIWALGHTPESVSREIKIEHRPGLTLRNL